MSKKLTQEEAVTRAKVAKGDKFDLSNIVYNGLKAKVNVVCNTCHHNFDTIYDDFVRGNGCPKCAPNQKKTTESFVSECKEAFGENYDYSLVEYISCMKKVKIICHPHGVFEIAPSKHLTQKQGCKKCANARHAQSRRLSSEEIVSRGCATHNSEYSYDRVDWSNLTSDRSKIAIECKFHGIFHQTIHDHLDDGTGCPKCAEYGFRRDRPGNLYILQSGDITKVGITNRPPSVRARKISKSAGKEFEVIFFIRFQDGSIVYKVEQDLLKELRSNYKSVDEKFDGSTECFLSVDFSKLLSSVTKYYQENLSK